MYVDLKGYSRFLTAQNWGAKPCSESSTFSCYSTLSRSESSTFYCIPLYHHCCGARVRMRMRMRMRMCRRMRMRMRIRMRMCMRMRV